jgi:Uma2 family endonuclease
MNTAADNWLPRHRIDVDAFHRMIETGILAADARVELIQGEMLDMAPIGNKHVAIVNRLTQHMVQACVGRAIVAIQQSLQLDRHSEPQPDVAVLKARADFYENKHASAADVFLLVEVSDSSLRYDREIKIPLYAQFGVPEVWLIDVQARRLTCLREPAQGRYTSSVVMNSGSVQIAGLPGICVDVGWILGQ